MIACSMSVLVVPIAIWLIMRKQHEVAKISPQARTLTKIMSSYEWHGDEMEKARADSASSRSYNTGSIFVR